MMSWNMNSVKYRTCMGSQFWQPPPQNQKGWDPLQICRTLP